MRPWPTTRTSTASPRGCGDARQIVVLTGAGISTESGIPDFRGPQGLWTKDPSAERKATIQHYVHDAEHRRDVWRNRAAGSERFGGEPNAGHVALAELERRANLHTLVTQNVDGLHQAAGTVARDRHRDPRHRARREVPGVRLARPDGGHPRPGARR